MHAFGLGNFPSWGWFTMDQIQFMLGENSQPDDIFRLFNPELRVSADVVERAFSCGWESVRGCFHLLKK